MSRTRPAGPRPALLAATWALGGAVAVSAGFGAVRLVGDEVAQRSAAPLSEGSVVDALSQLEPAPTPSSVRSPRPSPPPAPTSAPRRPPSTVPGSAASTERTAGADDASSVATAARPRSFVLVGGRVLVSCTGSVVSLRYAVPADGFRSEVDASEREKLEASFESPRHHSKLTVRCGDGVPVGEVEEQAEDGGPVTGSPSPDR